MQLFGEEVNTQVSVLPSGGRGSNADDLARATLEDQQVTNANVVGGDGDGVGGVGRDDSARGRLGAASSNGNVNLLPVMVVMVAPDDAFSSTVESMSEGVVVTWGS